MTKQLLIAITGAALLVSYFLFGKKYANAGKHLQFKKNSDRPNHHLTRVFADAKKHAIS